MEGLSKSTLRTLGSTMNEHSGGSGISSWAKKLLEKQGWSEGKGLGKNEDGTVSHIKVKKKDDTSALGFSVNNIPHHHGGYSKDPEWFMLAAANIGTGGNIGGKAAVGLDSDSSDSDDSRENGKRKKNKKKTKKSTKDTRKTKNDSDDSSSSSSSSSDETKTTKNKQFSKSSSSSSLALHQHKRHRPLASSSGSSSSDSSSSSDDDDENHGTNPAATVVHTDAFYQKLFQATGGARLGMRARADQKGKWNRAENKASLSSPSRTVTAENTKTVFSSTDTTSTTFVSSSSYTTLSTKTITKAEHDIKKPKERLSSPSSSSDSSDSENTQRKSKKDKHTKDSKKSKKMKKETKKSKKSKKEIIHSSSSGSDASSD